jgi:hypothetical protein
MYFIRNKRYGRSLSSSLASATFFTGFKTKSFVTYSNVNHFSALNHWSNFYNPRPIGCFSFELGRRSIATKTGLRDTAVSRASHQQESWETLKKALLEYKRIAGHLHVPFKFTIPSNDEQWSSDLWGIKLGFKVYSIRRKNRYSRYKAELEAMGFDFEYQKAFYGWER